MNTSTHERSIATVGTFTVTTHDGEWLVYVVEPGTAEDDARGEGAAAGMIRVSVEAASIFDGLFSLIADPGVIGSRTR